MGEQSQRESIDILNVRNQSARKYATNFQFTNCSIAHENQIQVGKAQTRTEKLQIKNHFVMVGQDQMMKLTEIQLQDKIIRIMDSFTCIPRSQAKLKGYQYKVQAEVQQANQQKKVYAKLLKVSVPEKRLQLRVRDMKNVVKNILKIFHGWLLSSSTSELLASSAFQSIFVKNREKFNNRLIEYLTKNEILRKAFLIFSENEGKELIAASKIKEKQSHVHALLTYKNICLRQESLSQENEQIGSIQKDE